MSCYMELIELMNGLGDADQRARINVQKTLSSSGYGDIDFWQSDEEWIAEFDAMLGDLPEIDISDESVDKKANCRHEWKCTYVSMLNNDIKYYNCKHCDIKKEDWEKQKNG